MSLMRRPLAHQLIKHVMGVMSHVVLCSVLRSVRRSECACQIVRSVRLICVKTSLWGGGGGGPLQVIRQYIPVAL